MTARKFSATAAALVLGLFMACAAEAQTATPSPAPGATPSPAMDTTPSPAPVTTPSPAAIAPSPTPAPVATASPSPGGRADQGVTANGEIVDIISHPAAMIEGKANRDDIFGAIVGGLKIVKAEIDKAGLKPAGRPLAIFLSATDEDFRYRVEIPLESAPDGKTQLSDAVKIGPSPLGKAMRFEHRGAYDDIDSTYDAITAYIDEKGVDAQEIFIEEYPTDLTSSEDPNTVVLIDVMLK